MYEQNYYGGGPSSSQVHHQQQSQIGYHQNSQKMHRSISNSNVSNQQQHSGGDCHVEYEVSMPVPIIRHAPYHSLWNLHQW